jgi:hypothetical protein
MLQVVCHPTQALVDKGIALSELRVTDPTLKLEQVKKLDRQYKWVRYAGSRACFMAALPVAVVEIAFKELTVAFSSLGYLLSKGQSFKNCRAWQRDLIHVFTMTNRLLFFGLTHVAEIKDLVNPHFAECNLLIPYPSENHGVSFERINLRQKNYTLLCAYYFDELVRARKSSEFSLRELESRAVYLHIALTAAGESIALIAVTILSFAAQFIVPKRYMHVYYPYDFGLKLKTAMCVEALFFGLMGIVYNQPFHLQKP